MVISNLHTIGITISPFEADAPLVVDPDAILPGPTTFELLKSITGWHSKVLKGIGRIEDKELAQCRTRHLR